MIDPQSFIIFLIKLQSACDGTNEESVISLPLEISSE